MRKLFAIFALLAVGNVCLAGQGWFTVDTATDELIDSAHGLTNGRIVYVMASGTSVLPAGLTGMPIQKYFVVGATTDRFQVSLTEGGAAVDITNSGTGRELQWISRIQQRYHHSGFEDRYLPMQASTLVEEGYPCSRDASGNVRELDTSDVAFVGFATNEVNNTGAAGALKLLVWRRGYIYVTVAGITDDDIGDTVYASDVDAYTFTASGNLAIGTVVGTDGTRALVHFDAD